MDQWGLPGTLTAGSAHWPTDSSRGINPVSCHSHNDYWQSIPLLLAIQAGCISVEADVWLFDKELFVGHTQSALTAERTLRRLYVEPLLDLLSRQNQAAKFNRSGQSLLGVFDTQPLQTLVLLIDFKNASVDLYSELLNQLSPLRQSEYLTYFNGTAIIERPITVVASGDAPFDLIAAHKGYRDIFYDAPLSELADESRQWPNPNTMQSFTKITRDNLIKQQIPRGSAKEAGVATLRPIVSVAPAVPSDQSQPEYSWQNSYYASTSFNQAIGSIEGSRLSQPQLQLLRAQIHGAHQKGLKARYWDVPHWPTGLRNHIWHILIREGADVLSVDDLIGATRRDWRKRKGWWYWSIESMLFKGSRTFGVGGVASGWIIDARAINLTGIL